MHTEIVRAAEFLAQMLDGRQCNVQLTFTQVALFKSSLINQLKTKYHNHWFPDHPNKGSAYRCIRINTKMDPIVAQACNAAGVSAKSLRDRFPQELTIWIDPAEVSCRFGENGSISVLYEKPKVAPNPPIFVPRQSPELYLDPRLLETFDPMADFILY